MNLNPVALNFWIFCSGLGYLVNGIYGLIVGLVLSTGMSLLGSFILRRDK